ncbi:amidase [Alcaligenaceae bacterium CGII-47]|nr:amidase [Alcaligenaceae bacterium CGII-47]
MSDILAFSVRELAHRISSRALRAQDVAQAYIECIQAKEPAIHAWQFFDPELVLKQARASDRQTARGPLHGVPIGVKDLMDTSDMPSTYGSPIYKDHRPINDAACVAASRSAGAIIMGKTVTTEFAAFQPGPTRNPRSLGGAPRTPGGSSSGSAAAVAAGMVPLAFGTQTAGSIVRPAAYCGIVGYKPSYGTLSAVGIKPLSVGLDTAGVLARCVDDAAFFVGALARLQLDPKVEGRLRVGVCHTPYWSRASADSRQALMDAVRHLERSGAIISDLDLPPACIGLNEAQIDIMGYEAAAAFEPEARRCAEGFSRAFAALIATGRTISGERYVAALDAAAAARLAFDSVFETIDIVLAPSTEGEAPLGLENTGDPVFNRMWSLLGNPCVHVPTGYGAADMPIGVTLIGPMRGDARTLSAAYTLERSLKD